jgi:hypothetical protein
MPWSPTISSLDVVAIHSVLVPTANGDGEILLFGGDDHDRQANIDGQVDHSRRFNCRTPSTPLIHVAGTAYAILFDSSHRQDQPAARSARGAWKVAVSGAPRPLFTLPPLCRAPLLRPAGVPLS